MECLLSILLVFLPEHPLSTHDFLVPPARSPDFLTPSVITDANHNIPRSSSFTHVTHPRFFYRHSVSEERARRRRMGECNPAVVAQWRTSLKSALRPFKSPLPPIALLVKEGVHAINGRNNAGGCDEILGMRAVGLYAGLGAFAGVFPRG